MTVASAVAPSPEGAAVLGAVTTPPPIRIPQIPSPLDFIEHRGAMLRFARRKIRDAELAEDAVQDALVAALASRESFQGQSALRTWLIGILNHKIQDAFRRESRYIRPEPTDSEAGDGGLMESAADRALAGVGMADEGWSVDPFAEVARRQLRERLIGEIDQLPPTLKEVFTLQALEGMATEEVCERLDISEANCWVRLHRARKRLSGRLAAHLS